MLLVRAFQVRQEPSGLGSRPFSLMDWEQSRIHTEPKGQELGAVSQLYSPKENLLLG